MVREQYMACLRSRNFALADSGKNFDSACSQMPSYRVGFACVQHTRFAVQLGGLSPPMTIRLCCTRSQEFPGLVTFDFCHISHAWERGRRQWHSVVSVDPKTKGDIDPTIRMLKANIMATHCRRHR